MHKNNIGVEFILKQLGVPKNGVIFVHASAKWLLSSGISLKSAIYDLHNFCDEGGTVVMPSFPFFGAHLDYMKSNPRFDFAKTPAKIGLFYEIFRRGDSVFRSIAPDLPVAAKGRYAKEIIGLDNSLADPDPIGRESIFAKILDFDPQLVGLGVTENTNIFIHLVDSLNRHRYPGAVLTNEINTATTKSHDGNEIIVHRHSFIPHIQKLIKPNKIFLNYGKQIAFNKFQIGQSIYFSWKINDWMELALSEVKSSQEAGRWPSWLTEMDKPNLHLEL